MTLLVVDDLSVRFGSTTVVDGVSFTLRAGECIAIVGPSGSGKSVTARSLLGLTGGSVSGSIALDGTEATPRRQRAWRGREIGYVSQGALVALDPLRPIAREVADGLRLHTTLSAADRAARVEELLGEVGIPDPAVRARQRSGELSGGLRQRAVIASAIAAGPRVLVADEPTTALDSTVASGIVALLARLRDAGTAIVFISHDLATVSRIASRVLVLSEGRIVEQGPTASVLGSPRHRATRELLASAPTAVPRHTPLLPPLLPPPAGNSGVGSPDGRGAPLAAARTGSTPEFPARARARARAESGDADEVMVEGRGLVRRYGQRVALDAVDLDLRRGRTLGVVGESGSGKTTLARLVLALESPDAGAVTLDREPWSGVRETDRRSRRHRIAAVYQDALSSFDPRWTVGRILADASPDGRAGIHGLLDAVGLPRELSGRRPRLLSGGQQQRVAIARAIAADPDVLVCDEPVSSLDVSSQARILDLIDRLQAERGLAIMFISHDLGVIRHMSDEVLVMRDGRVLESGETERVFAAPTSDYTRALIAAAPTLTP